MKNEHSAKSSLPKAYDVEAREREERKRKRREGEQGREELDSFPVMMSFKAFLETQDDSITDEEAIVKYGEYKLEFKRQKLNEFFVSHKLEEWFRSQYHPQEFASHQHKMRQVVRRRCQIFKELMEKGFIDGVSCAEEQETEIVKLLDSVVILLEGGNYEDIKNLDLELNNNDLVKHKSSSLFIKHLHPTVTRSELLELVQKYPGFQRLAISEADPRNNFARRSWVSFQRNAKIREICFAMNNVQLKGVEVQAVVNKDLSKRTRACEDILGADRVLENDLQIALSIVKFQDAKHGLWTEKKGTENSENVPPPTNPEIKVEKPDTVPTEKGDMAGPSVNPLVEEAETGAEEVKTVLDKLILYLRVVHSIDFYSQKEYKNEDEMPNRCGLMHIRSSKVEDLDETKVDKFINSREEKFRELLTSPVKVDDAEARKLGFKDEESEIDKFVSANSQELAKDKWLCTLSGKKFKALEFIKKHIVNKFPDKINEVRTEVTFFNHYILDLQRPQIPEQEKPVQQPMAKKVRTESPAAAEPPAPGKKGIHARLGVRETAATRAPAVRVTHATSDPRALIDYSDIDSSVFDLFG